MYVRPIISADREPLVALLGRIEQFRADEVEVAVELIDDAIKRPEMGYEALVLVTGETEQPLGYVCFGKTPMTAFTYDLYWIAVDPETQGKGVGTRLLHALEALLRQRGGGNVRVETSSQEEYDGTVAFYLRNGYETVGRISQFYREDDDLIILCKRLLAGE
ncbi:MAG: GNAT family N-acetyltransferase [Myxococcales bacterium]|nr:GNAT family N-acetyltransferase [Myxococcales bacterium]